MSLISNVDAKLVTVDDVETVVYNNMQNITEGEYFRDGGYYWEGYNIYGGCGNANGDAGVIVVLKDNMLYNRVMVFFEMTGTASCWSFLGNSGGAGFGNGGPNVPPEYAGIYKGGNMKPYAGSVNNDPQGNFYWQTNAFDSNSNFTYKWSACDNNNQNFFHGAWATGGGGYKSLWTWGKRASNRLSTATPDPGYSGGVDGSYNGRTNTSGPGVGGSMNIAISGGVVTSFGVANNNSGYDYEPGTTITIPSSSLGNGPSLNVTVNTVSNNLGGVHFGRSCAGTNQLSRISGIYRWYEPE